MKSYVRYFYTKDDYTNLSWGRRNQIKKKPNK